MHRALQYILINSFVILLVMTGIYCIVDYLLLEKVDALPLALICVFFILINSFSILARVNLTNNSRSLTIFYLVDKVCRFFVSIFLIGLLIYVYKSQRLMIGIISFIVYIVAMVVEVMFFFSLEKRLKYWNR